MGNPSSGRAAAMRKHEAAQQRLTRLVDLWMARLWMKDWKVDVVWEWNGIDNPVAGHCTYAECDARWEYQQASIRFSIPACSTLSDADLSKVVLHELLHCAVNEAREQGIKHEERVVTHLTNVVDWAWGKRA